MTYALISDIYTNLPVLVAVLVSKGERGNSIFSAPLAPSVI
jgi:hypothetical protein